MTEKDPLRSGYFGGFSSIVGGEAFGYLSPFFNGVDYHGQAVQVDLSRFRDESAETYCEDMDPAALEAGCVFRTVDLEAVDPQLKGFTGGFVYDGKAYFIPFHNGEGAATKLVRIDAVTFDAASVEVLDVGLVDPTVGGFAGGFESQGMAYLVPSRANFGPVGGVNTKLPADGHQGYNYFTGTIAELHEAGSRLTAHYSSKLVRVDLSTFTAAGVEVLDLALVDEELRGFSGGFAAGDFGYLVPYKHREEEGQYSGKVVRINLSDFTGSGVTVLNLADKDPGLQGYVGGFAHGKWGVLVPYSNGQAEVNPRGRSQSGEVVFVDLTDFSVAGVQTIDLAKASRQQMPPQPDPNLRGFVGGFAFGPHIYVSPHSNGIFFGSVARLDMQDMLEMAAGNTPEGNDGLQVLNLQQDDRDYAGFSGMFHSHDTSCH
ncbi:unnamed protein product [Chrysoparadoxa australica]